MSLRYEGKPRLACPSSPRHPGGDACPPLFSGEAPDAPHPTHHARTGRRRSLQSDSGRTRHPGADGASRRRGPHHQRVLRARRLGQPAVHAQIRRALQPDGRRGRAGRHLAAVPLGHRDWQRQRHDGAQRVGRSGRLLPRSAQQQRRQRGGAADAGPHRGLCAVGYDRHDLPGRVDQRDQSGPHRPGHRQAGLRLQQPRGNGRAIPGPQLRPRIPQPDGLRRHRQQRSRLHLQRRGDPAEQRGRRHRPRA